MPSLEHILNYLFEHRVLTHILYWVLFFIFSCLYGLGQGEPLLVSVILELNFLPIQIVASYVFIYFQIPLLANKKYVLFILYLILFGYAFNVLLHINNDHGIGRFLISGHQQHPFPEIFTKGFNIRYLVDIYLVVFLTTGIKLIKNQNENRQLIESIKAEKIKSEYNLLQSKVQPEFLMNALQYIQEKSKIDIDSTPETIAQLSEVLDYSLYQSRQDKIAIEKEIDACKTYLSLFQKSSQYEQAFTINQEGVSAKTVVPLTLVHYLDTIVQHIRFDSIEDFTVTFIQGDSGVDLIIKFKHIKDDKPSFQLAQHIFNSSLLQLHYDENYNIELLNKSVTSIQLKINLNESD